MGYKLKGCECPDPNCGTKAYEGFKKVYEQALKLAEERLKSGETIMEPFAEAYYCLVLVQTNFIMNSRVEEFRQSIGPELIDRIADRAKEELQKEGVVPKDGKQNLH